MYNGGVIRFESRTISHKFAAIFAATGPKPRWNVVTANTNEFWQSGELHIIRFTEIVLECIFYIADIDECSSSSLHNCTNNAGAVCENTIGGFRCVCENGFAGNGTTCVGE